MAVLGATVDDRSDPVDFRARISGPSGTDGGRPKQLSEFGPNRPRLVPEAGSPALLDGRGTIHNGATLSTDMGGFSTVI